MSDNLALWEKEADLKILKQNVLELDEQLGGLDVDNLNVQQDMYEAEYDKYRKEVVLITKTFLLIHIIVCV